jgi:hypothetical protein
MSEIDHVVPAIVVEKKGVVNLADLYSLMKKWLEKRKYAVIEKEYTDEGVEEKKLSIKWVAEKEVDDYTRFVIEVGVKGDVKNVELKKKKAVKGVITVKFESYLEMDYRENWENSPIVKFFRGIYDKLALGNRFSRFTKELKEETYDLYYEVKSYLGMNELDR